MKLVVTTSLLYEELFSIVFSHDSFNVIRESRLSDELSIIPDKNTEKLFSKHCIGFSFSDNKFICYIQCKKQTDAGGEFKTAFILPASNLKFRLLLNASSNFMKRTVNDPGSTGNAYYFNNRQNAGVLRHISNDHTGVKSADKKPISDLDSNAIALSVIDIFCNNAFNNQYELFTGTNGRLNSPPYRIHFKAVIN